MYDEGEIVICQHEDWYNAHGSNIFKLEVGQKLTINNTYRVGGSLFLKFKEYDDEYGFLSTGFTRLRSLN